MGNPEFEGDGRKVYPSRTAGSGRLRSNSARTGRGQGRGSPKKMVKCRQCGFLVDASKTARGGTYSGDGGLGTVVVTTTTGTTLAGASMSETYGDKSVPAGAGCPLCGSKNFIRS